APPQQSVPRGRDVLTRRPQATPLHRRLPMTLTWFQSGAQRTFGSLRRRPRGTSRRPATFRPQLESLEARLVAATPVWDGGSVLNANWMTDRNWEGNDAPVAGDDLVFPQGVSVADRATTNNFPSGTQFRSITFEASGYTLSGNRITLGADGSSLDG